MRWRQRQQGCGSLAAATAASLAVEGAAWRKRDFVGSGNALGSAGAALLSPFPTRCHCRRSRCCRRADTRRLRFYRHRCCHFRCCCRQCIQLIVDCCLCPRHRCHHRCLYCYRGGARWQNVGAVAERRLPRPCLPPSHCRCAAHRRRRAAGKLPLLASCRCHRRHRAAVLPKLQFLWYFGTYFGTYIVLISYATRTRIRT